MYSSKYTSCHQNQQDEDHYPCYPHCISRIGSKGPLIVLKLVSLELLAEISAYKMMFQQSFVSMTCVFFLTLRMLMKPLRDQYYLIQGRRATPESLEACNCYTNGNQCTKGLSCNYTSNKQQHFDVFNCGLTYCDATTKGCRNLNECCYIADDCAFMDATNCGKAFNKVTNGQMEFVAVTDICPNVNCDQTNAPTSTAAANDTTLISALLVPMAILLIS